MSLKSLVGKLPPDAHEEEPELRACGSVAGGDVVGNAPGDRVAGAAVRPWPADRKVECPRLLQTMGTSASHSSCAFAISVSPTTRSAKLSCLTASTQV